MKLGRSRCDQTVEQRFTFGQFERKKIDEILAQQERNIWLDAIPSIGMGAIGVGAVLAGYGILRWAGVTIENLADDVKSWIDKVADKASDAIVDALPPTPAQQRIEEIRLRLLAIHARMNEINALITGDPSPPWAAILELHAEGKRLSDEEDALRLELNAYTTGEKGWQDPGGNGISGSAEEEEIRWSEEGHSGPPGSWDYNGGNGNGNGTPGPPHIGT